MIGNLKRQISSPFLRRFIIVCCLLTFPGPISLCWAEPKVWYADPNTGIQSVIDSASSGDRVVVRKGDYDEGTILMKEGVSLVGDPNDFGSVKITGDPNGAVILAASNATIANLIICNGEVGIYCYYKYYGITTKNNLIRNNLIGMMIESDKTDVINNTIVNNSDEGILIFMDSNGPAFHADENIIAFNGPFGGIEFVLQYDPNIEDPNVTIAAFLDSNDVRLAFNDLCDDLYIAWYDSNELIPISSFTNSFGPGNFSENPFFVDPNGGDFRLLSYSPCIDRGDPNKDYSLEPFPNGGRLNLGFYGNTSHASISIDTDEDGLKDFQEGPGDMDGDGFPDWNDVDTAIIPLPWITEKVAIHLQTINPDPNHTPQFKDVKMVLPSELTNNPTEGILPFNAIQFGVIHVEKETIIRIKMIFPEDYRALEVSRYLALSSNNAWQSIPFETDPNEKAITFQIQDGQIWDRDSMNEGVIEHLGALVIPRMITWDNPGTCFISIIHPFFDLDHPGFQFSKHNEIQNHQIWEIFNSTLALLCLFFYFLALFLIYPSSKNELLRKRHFFTLLIFILILFLFSHGWAQPQEDIEITSSPNPVGSGARALGMGGAFIGIADDATAASWNPAGLKHLGRPEISWVESYSSRKEAYFFEENPGASGTYRQSDWDVNYLSLAFPGRLFKRNFVISLNYQHIYDFSKRVAYQWRWFSVAEQADIDFQAIYEQSGGIKALSPALAVIITPRFTLGLTLNIWSDRLFNNEWIEKYHKEGQGEVGAIPQSVVTHVDVLERYSFSGLNVNLGLLWDIGETLTLGMVYKSPFKADLEHTLTEYKIEEYPDNPSLNNYLYSIQKDQEQLSMPMSYGIGLAYHPIDALVIDLDVYRTEWDDYELIKADGNRINPITGFSKSKVKVKPIHQVRLGAEYAFVTRKDIIPSIRGGVFYDPSPAPNKADDFYGVSLGLGMTLREKKRSLLRRTRKRERKDIMSIDMAYQYRWGRQLEGETIQGVNSPADVDHHLIYFSIIYYI
ncbi:MAG: outer membrane protein transport protein [Promethearchaeota archaeon]